MSKKQKIFNRIFAILAISFTLVLATVLFACNKKVETKEDNRFLKTQGNKIINQAGEEVIFKGLNAGGLFVPEGWMSPVKDSSLLPSEQIDQKKIIAKLKARFGEQKTNEIIDSFEKSWWTEIDFDNVKKAGFNSIRLPFTYMNLEDEDGNITKFERLDWFIDMCDKKDIYVILDLHGAYGSQNGKDHSGDTSGANLFNSAESMKKTENLWIEVSKRYKDKSIVAGYDLLNEPEGDSGRTNLIQWAYFKRLYDAIGKRGDEHIIIIESVWEADNLPKPSFFGDYKNLVYSFHEYNWPINHLDDSEKLECQKEFINNKIQNLEKASFGVPIYVGEFNVFSHMPSWKYTLEKYAENNISWSFWTYKVKDVGSNWGYYTPLKSLEIIDIDKDSYEEIIQKTKTYATASSFTINKKLAETIQDFTN